MPRNLFNASDADAALHRLATLRPDDIPRWGAFTPTNAVCRLADPFRVAVREKTAAPLGAPLSLPVLSSMIVWFLPWPKGAPTAPEFLPGTGMTEPTGFERDRQALTDVMRRFVSLGADEQIPPNPVFGRLASIST